MKIFGFDTNKKQAKDFAEAKPARKSIRRGEEIGDTGTNILQGIINEEYNNDLREVRGIDKYDEMRKSDGSVRAAVLATSLPIRRSNWFVEPASDSDEDIEIAQFINQALMETHDMSWDDLLRQALLCLPFGVMVFEKVYDVMSVDGKERVVYSKIAPRLPKKIYAWEMRNGEPGIQQVTSLGKTVDIPMEKLVVIVNEKEGANMWGTSILRAAYKHWKIKNAFYKIDAIAFERQGLGIPYANLQEGSTDNDRERARKTLQNMRAHEQGYVLTEGEMEVGFLDMKANTTRDPEKSIMHHNREIVKSVLAHFLELGATDSGSRALSEDQSDLFLLSLEAVAKNIAGAFNKQAVRELVDLNFNNVQRYPKLRPGNISRKDVKSLAETFKILVEAGGILAGDKDEQYFREMLELPERDGPAEGSADFSETKKKDNSLKVFEYNPSREMTFAEEKVNFKSISDNLDKIEAQFEGETKKLLQAENERFIKDLTKAVNNNDTKAIKKATFKVRSSYEAILKSYFKQAYVFGKNNASKEIGVKTPPNPNAVMQQLDIAASAIAERHTTEIPAKAKTALTEALGKGESIPVALAAVDKLTREQVIKLVTDTKNIAMAAYLNQGRNTVFDRYADDIYALQRSELLDSATCNFCLSVDGRIVEKDDPFARNSIFHSGCRGIWVAILKDEEQKPTIGGVPDSLRDRFGDAINDLIQPKSPSNTSKNPEAQKEIKKRRDKRIDDQKKKD